MPGSSKAGGRASSVPACAVIVGHPREMTSGAPSTVRFYPDLPGGWPACRDWTPARLAAAHHDRARVETVLREVTALYTCGPAGGGGVRTAITPRLHSASCLVARALVPATFRFMEE